MIQSVISIVGRVVEPFGDGSVIHALGFGDVETKGNKCFPLASTSHCAGYTDVLDVYNEITPTVVMSGPTNFAPVIHETIKLAKRSGEAHILVIIADGQVTSEVATCDAIVEASNWPIGRFDGGLCLYVNAD